MSQSGSPAPRGVGSGVIGYTTEMTRREWTTTEHLHDSGAFESVQLTVVSGPAVEESEAGARWLGMAYWRSVTDVTRGAVRATWSAQGGRLRLLGGPTLLRFGLPVLRHDGGLISCRYTIEGGLLALRAGGTVTLQQRRRGDEHELSVDVEGYRPRLAPPAGWPSWAGVLYARGQQPFHAAVSRHYFDIVARGSA
jgi:hypothetical protein